MNKKITGKRINISNSCAVCRQQGIFKFRWQRMAARVWRIGYSETIYLLALRGPEV